MTQPGWLVILQLERQLVELQRDAHRDSAETDRLAEDLELRVAAIEEVIAAPWPRRILVRRRLRRDLRRSVAHVQGAGFAEKRFETAAGWIERRP
jgi:hypothetical protein